MEKLVIIWYIFSMKNRFFTGTCRVFLAALLLCLITLPLKAQGFFSKISWFAEGSVLFFPEDNGVHSDPMPILPSLGAGASYPISDTLRAELTLDLYTTHYGYSDELSRPVPEAIENRTARVIGSLLGFQLAGYFDVSSKVTVRAYGGPTADLRIVLVAAGLEAHEDMKEVRKDVNKVRSYFWSQGRWLMPVIGTGADYTLNERFKLGIDFRVWMPMYRLWTGENLPAIEGWRFGPGIRLTIQ